MIAHLVDVGPDGKGELITHGTRTWTERERVAADTYTLTIDLYTTAWQLAPGHHLALALDGLDAEYGSPSALQYKYRLDGAAGALRLDVPMTTAD